MSLIRSILFSIGYFVLTIIYGSLSVLVWLFPMLTRHKIITSWTTLIIFWVRISCGVRYQVLGFDKLNMEEGPYVILSKHQSTWETLFLQSLFWPSSTVLKKELTRIPFFGWGLMAMNPIAIDRSNPREALKQVKEKGIRRLKSGLNVILFPEGTRMKFGERGVYARSGADIATKAQVNVIPVALNAAKCWPSKSFVKKPGLITVSIGPVIETHDKTSKEVIREVEEWIENEMISLEKL